MLIERKHISGSIYFFYLCYYSTYTNNKNMPPIYVNSSGKQIAKIIEDGKETTHDKVEWDAEYDGENATLEIQSDIDGKKKKDKRILSNKDLEGIFKMPTVDESITERIRADFLQPHRFSPHGYNGECRPSLVPMDMNDPALQGYPNIEHQAYVVPPIGRSKKELEEYKKIEEGNAARNIIGSIFTAFDNTNKERREKKRENNPYQTGLLGDYLRSFSMRSKSMNTQNTRKKRKSKSRSKSKSKSKSRSKSKSK